ncbi:alpha/beta hydrolase [Nonomuraea sp. WAC 01424]|uniref:alpha/beta hydrolase family protein n=1 Tax=Nonomuraea sp. WAC 01424 TaxID=2203200 RepID=UPI000F78DDBA|nr:alpha/beta hydrolase [Nonomuraea sp. WAC 01424]RSN14666.1 alpha/beta hydrolase [Nonomuraea sp. WAC 01424]
MRRIFTASAAVTLTAVGSALLLLGTPALGGTGLATAEHSAQSLSTGPVVPGDLTAHEVTFRGNGGLELRGSVISPAKAATAPRAGVVLVHGAGTGTRREKLLGEAVAFARQGLSVLIYDKRSEGYSLYQRSYGQLADDALGAVRTLRQEPGVDPGKVGVWGLSEGGWVAPLAASRSKEIAFVVVVGANALQPLRQQTWAVAAGLRKAGVGGSLVDHAEPNLYRVIADGGMFPAPYFDPEPVLGAVRQPVLGIWGTNDLLTPPRETPPLFRAALEKGGNKRYTFRFFEGADHAAHRTPDGGVTRLPELAPGYPELVGSWVAKATSGQAPVAEVSGPAPVQADDSVGVPPPAWWESAFMQLVALVLFLVGFAGYPIVAAVRRVRGRGGVTGTGAARLVSAGGLVAVLGGFAYLFYLISTGGKLAAPGPVVAGRPVVWLALQAVAVATVVATVLTARRWRREDASGERVRTGLLVVAGVVFVPWAFYWGLLLP